MPRLQLAEVVECKHQDVNNPAENLLSEFRGVTGAKWLSDPDSFNISLVTTIRLSSPSILERIEIGNAGSITVAVVVSESGIGKYSVLLPEQTFRTEEEIKTNKNMSAVKVFTDSDFKSTALNQPWMFLKIICYNSRRKSAVEQFGLSHIHVYGKPYEKMLSSIRHTNGMSVRTFNPFVKNSPIPNSPLSRREKMMIAAKANSTPTSPVESKTCSVDDDVFDVTVISFLESKSVQNLSGNELLKVWEDYNERVCSARERQRFLRLTNDYRSATTTGFKVLTPRDDNRPRNSVSLTKSIKETTLSVLKPHLNDNLSAFGRDNSTVVYRSEVSLQKPVKENGVSYVDQKENQHPFLISSGKCNNTQDGGCTPESVKKSFKDNRKIWTGGRSEEDEEDDEEVSPSQNFKRKSDTMERGLSVSKKRLRDAKTNGTNAWISSRRPQSSPLRNGRVPSPQPAQAPQPRPESPLVDDIDAPSTSSKETVAERNIRLEIERRLAQRTPQDRVIRGPSGKVRGPYCTKGMRPRTSPSEANSPLRRLSISEEADDESRQARRKLNFPKTNGGVTNMVECPFCSGLFDSVEIEQHASECTISPKKQFVPEDDEEGDQMACPICLTFVSRDTVAAHADQCALKRYGA